LAGSSRAASWLPSCAAACVTVDVRIKPCPVDADVVLVTEDRYRDLGRRLALGAAVVRHRRLAAALDHRPAAVAVYLRPLRLRPVGRGAAALDRLLLGAGELRPARLNDGGVDDLPTHRQIAALA
jgi:hypothetical protein